MCKLISSNFAFESANTQLLHEGTALRAKFSLSSQGVTANSNIFVLPGERPETKKEADEEVAMTYPTCILYRSTSRIYINIYILLSNPRSIIAPCFDIERVGDCFE